MKILVVDDDPLSQKMVAKTLQQANYDVATADNGCEALEILRGGNHRLVVSDWQMPETDGVELCRVVRSGEFSNYIYFIMLTGRTETMDAIEGLRAGADDYVRKPFNPAELMLRVNIGRRILELQTREKAMAAAANLVKSVRILGAEIERAGRSADLERVLSLAAQIDIEANRYLRATAGMATLGGTRCPVH